MGSAATLDVVAVVGRAVSMDLGSASEAPIGVGRSRRGPCPDVVPGVASTGADQALAPQTVAAGSRPTGHLTCPLASRAPFHAGPAEEDEGPGVRGRAELPPLNVQPVAEWTIERERKARRALLLAELPEFLERTS